MAQHLTTGVDVFYSTQYLRAGPKELPSIARNVGRYAGRAVAFVQAGRKQIFQFAEETEITKVHE